MNLFGSSATGAARGAAKAAADAGHEIFDLTAGEIWSDIAPNVREGALSAINRGINRYSDAIGLGELREAIAKKLTLETHQSWSAGEVAVTTGAKQALFNAAMALLNPGDEVIIPAPYWSTFPAQVLIAGATPVFVQTRASGFCPKIEDIQSAVTPRTRAIVINTPNNPTGAVYGRDALLEIGRFAVEHSLWLIFDECYADFTHNGTAHHSLVSLLPELRPRLVIVNAFSKSLALTGWRIGYLAGPADIISAARALQSHTTSNPNIIAQHAVLAHLRSDDQTFQDGLRTRLSIARDVGLTVLRGLRHVPVPTADGAFYFYLDLAGLLRPAVPEGPRKTASDVSDFLLARAGVATVAGTAFGDPLGLRISYGVPADMLVVALTRLVEALNTWK